ncbi:Methyltransferase domain-containing protein [Malonomonas rubra DSM 5091]|uniref:Methyltransferase domain-containing protein n=1 Tax=Malonomonas rubra DSM 5091 TaxID=1122189 RepID=A0A1M6H368_MALRU|nr:methyltransferase domain-containing protein [Malonomonas rubra]SHJ16643.1 Methyltransferase domain-containing protein [Malonomonas rubra DSM 5091]
MVSGDQKQTSKKACWRVISAPHSCDVETEVACGFGVRSPEFIFDELNLKAGDCFLDAGCGPGEYAMLAAKRVDTQGAVIALDRDPFMIRQVKRKAESLGIENISAQLGELGTPLALADQGVDSCLVSAVLHMPGLDDRWDVLFGEIYRVLRFAGRLGIVERCQENVSPDQPLHLRLTPETIIAGIEQHGFQKCKLVELGSSCFIVFERI